MRYRCSICWGLILVLGFFNVSVAQEHVRKRYEHILNWLPADSESLTVIDCPWQVPAQHDEKDSEGTRSRRPFDASVRDCQFRYMFSADQRKVLTGKTVRLWISAASDFHIANPPKEVETHIVPDSYSLRYTGVHIIEFEPESRFVASDLFTTLMKTPVRRGFSAATA